MKRVVLCALSLLLGLTSLWGQQTIDLLDYVTKYMRDPEFEPEKGVYIEDQRGVLKPFVGYWVGEYGDYVYEFGVEILKKRSLAEGKRFADGLSVICHIYKRGANGKWRLYLSNGSDYSEEKILEFFSIMYHPKLPGHDFLYESTLEGQQGNVSLKILSEGALKLLYYEPDYKYKTISGPQPFPVWDTYKDEGEAVMLRRVSTWKSFPKEQCLPQGEAPTKEKSLFYQMINLGRALIRSPHFSPDFTNGLRVVPIDYKEAMANSFRKIDELENSGADAKRVVSSGVRQAVGLRGAYEVLLDKQFLRVSSLTYLSARLYHRYYQAYMLYVLSQKGVDLTDSDIYVHTLAPRDYFSDLVRVYMSEEGLSLSQFKQDYLDLGMRLFDLGDFGDTKELRKLLDDQLRGL